MPDDGSSSAKMVTDVGLSTVDPNALRHAKPAKTTQGGRLLSVLCLLGSVAAACVTLTAPVFRPWLAAALSDAMGPDFGPVQWLTPPPPEAPPIDPTPLRLIAALRADVTALGRDIRAIDTRLTALDTADRNAIQTLNAAIGDLTRSTEQFDATARKLSAQSHAAGLIALAARLQRDLDVGAPLSAAVEALRANGPYPPAIETALGQLARTVDGVPTMRDLLIGFEALATHIAAGAVGDQGWAERGWARLTSLAGGTAESEPPRLEQLRRLTAAGRFNEAATLFAQTPWAGLAAEWIARVHRRADAAIAVRAVASYALAAHQSAFGP